MATPPPAEASRFYLRPHADPPEPWHEVSRAEYIQAERAAGFSAPSGLPATYAFGADYIEGCSRASGEPAPDRTASAADL